MCMPYVKRKFHCDTCGKWTIRKLSSKQRRRCQECGILAMVQVTRTMASKSGAQWEAWKASAGPSGRPRKHTTEE